jgi:DNA-binding response OmpR family regulator
VCNARFPHSQDANKVKRIRACVSNRLGTSQRFVILSQVISWKKIVFDRAGPFGYPASGAVRWMSGETILVVDDEAKIVKTVRAYLDNAGFRTVVALDGQTALSIFRREKPVLVILDLGLPGLDGLDVARILRRESDVPLIMLTARVDEADKLIGLELGADDYMTKPFSPRELVARVRAVLRRTAPERELTPAPIVVDDVHIDVERRLVRVGGHPVDLTATEFDLLTVLARHPGRVFTRLELLERVQGYGFEGYERTVDAHIKNLRHKLEPNPKKPRYLLTVYGVGYKFGDA